MIDGLPCWPANGDWLDERPGAGTFCLIPATTPTNKLVFEPSAYAAGREGARTLFWLFAMPPAVAAFAGGLGGSTVAIVALLGALALAVGLRRSRTRITGAVLLVEDNTLTIVLGDAHGPHDRFGFDDLLNVTLDVKTIQPLIDGPSAIPALRMASTVAPAVDTARIVFVGETGNEVRLTEEYLPHMVATEWLGKVRVFLRKNGWVPEDECGTADQ
jgi:hypothetical protein